jgi:hypothetical protein
LTREDGRKVALGFGRAKSNDVVSLIAAKKYGPAIEILRVQLKKRGASTTVRKQLADVLVLSGKTVEAVALLLPLADKFAREGFAAKAVSVLKKIQKIDPGRSDVEERLARLIEEKQREASIALPISQPGAEIGMEAIGIDAPPSGSIGLMVEPPANLPTDDGPALEIGFGSAPISTPMPSPEPSVSPEPVVDAPRPEPEEPKTAEPVAAPPTDAPALDFGSTASRALEDSSPDATLPLPDPPPPDLSEEGVLDLGAKPIEDDTAASDEVEDYDLLYEPEGEEAEEEVVAPAASADDLMSEAGFADELMSLVDSVFDAPAEAPAEASAGPATGAGPQRAGGQIVVSPLFRDFSVDEMVAVIQGLKLLTFDRGEVILQEGQPGASLYTLTSGRVRAFRKDQQTGKQVQIGDLKEGAFFGEMSILTGQPRAASIVALNSCELLELDRAALDGITSSHPHVWDVLREFAEKRS